MDHIIAIEFRVTALKSGFPESNSGKEQHTANTDSQVLLSSSEWGTKS